MEFGGSEVKSAASKPLRIDEVRCLAWNGSIYDLSIPNAVIEVEGQIVIEDPNFVEINYENELDCEITSKEVNSGSTQPWLVTADDGSRSDTINIEHPIGTRTQPNPQLLTELRGPKVTEAALEIFGGISKPTIETDHWRNHVFGDRRLYPFIEKPKEGLHVVDEDE